ncbi:juvenile hormone esterase-like isoform X2 [Athalia rosae]|uniref:juvenile hormone esterase-like isoform X2 n=1 Tax=Athalia rosae TaxID=37344 RepID=UPI002033F703|nr:juvenile hormone esterase-like isoform X2 [Athalia rosae]
MRLSNIRARGKNEPCTAASEGLVNYVSYFEQDPLPPLSWTGIREAVNFGNSCGQFDVATRKIIGGDDCLYLNIYAPLPEEGLPRRSDLPVMVWIHGGGFVMGSGDDFLFGPDYLVKKNVIVVSINYRLGVLGFLNLEHKVAPGNQGLKDQIMALRWIREHVQVFGGEKSNVTIFGESAGAASVHYLTLSPLAQGLFHKAIAQSSSGFCPWASKLSNPKRDAMRLLEYLKINSTNEREIVDRLKTVECSKLIEAQTKIQTPQEKISCVWLFGPGNDDAADVPFLPKFSESIKNGVVKVPLILGYNNGEGIIFSKTLNSKSCEAMNEDFEYLVHPKISDDMKRGRGITAADLKLAYFGDGPLHPERSMRNFVNFMSDMQFTNAIYELAKRQVKKGREKTWLYRFSFDKGMSFLKLVLNATHLPGACHADELAYLFYPHGLVDLGFLPPEKGSKERILIERITGMWTDFAKIGNPTPGESEFVKINWEPIKSVDELNCMEIDEELGTSINPDLERLLIWNRLPNKL